MRAAGLFCVLASAVAVPMTLTDEEMAHIASKVDEIDCSTDSRSRSSVQVELPEGKDAA